MNGYNPPLGVAKAEIEELTAAGPSAQVLDWQHVSSVDTLRNSHTHTPTSTEPESISGNSQLDSGLRLWDMVW